jgi:L-alanine-DL-glutamate epimerase-like enolase superfamily enzyme
MAHDLAWFYEDEAFAGVYPEDFFVDDVPAELPVWHLVGGKDLLLESERVGNEPEDGYPVSLEKWIERDGLKCLKIKLTGSDAQWDYNRVVAIGNIALKYGVKALSPDFNCLVKDPAYVNDILDKLKAEYPAIFDLLIYVEQPFPYDLEANQIDVHSCSQRKPLFMDESAHDWKFVRLGLSLGWNGVALKVCKTQTGALLSACWAKKNNMLLMVQDLTNPMLATVPHVQLAAHVGTIMGVECNAPQFYPAASLDDEKLRPGLYERRNGVVSLKALSGNGFGY